MSSTKKNKVVIVGGGIMGSFVAWFLRRDGFEGDITVVEKDPSYEFCSTTLSAASIRTQFTTRLNIRMSLFGSEFIQAVKDIFGSSADVGFTEKGYLILAGAGSAETRRAGVEMQRQEGADVVALTPEEIEARFPWISTEGVDIGTFGVSNEGWFDAWSLLYLLRSAAKDMTIRYVAGHVEDFDVHDDGVRAVRLASGEHMPCDWCVMAAGAASGALTSMMGQPLPVTPRKRTVFCFRAPVEADNFPMLFDSSGIWVRPERGMFIGGIQPPAERDFDATGDYEPDYSLMEDVFWPALATRIPAMEALRLERAWAGHYEINELDHNGIVGPHDVLDNLLFATGFSGHGLMHAPAIGRGVAEFIQHGAYTSLDLSPLGYQRIRTGKKLPEDIMY